MPKPEESIQASPSPTVFAYLRGRWRLLCLTESTRRKLSIKYATHVVPGTVYRRGEGNSQVSKHLAVLRCKHRADSDPQRDLVHILSHIPRRIHSHMLELVSWSLTFHFSTNMAISETKGQGWRATQWRKASNIWTCNPGRLFVQQPPEKGKGSRGSFKLLRYHLQQGKSEDNYRTARLN